MNVKRCAGFKYFGKYCAYLKFTLDKDRKPDESSATCALRGIPRDDYRLYPEHNSDGSIVYQRIHLYPEHNSDGSIVYQRIHPGEPFPVGPNIIWESLSPHDTGLTFSIRRIPEDHDLHPLYSVEEINEPASEAIGERTILTPFGCGPNLSFSTTGWKSQKILGLERVSKCYPGIYGAYDVAAKMVVPKCIKDYCGVIPHWNNYTVIPSAKTRQCSLVLVDSTNKDIVDYCKRFFGETKLALTIAEIMIAIKGGTYIPLRKALFNNGVSETIIRNFLQDVNVRSKQPNKTNLFKYYQYYFYLKTLSKEKSFVYRANLLNYLLNDTVLETMDPRKPDGVFKDGAPMFTVQKRYWWLLMILKDVLREQKKGKALLRTELLPNWLIAMIDELTEKPPKQEEPQPKAAPHETLLNLVKDIEGCPIQDKQWERKARVFDGIAKAGKRWTRPTIRAAWFHFCKAYDGKSPRRFWEWLEIVKTANEEQMFKLMVDYINDAPEKAFALHLLEHMKSKDSFEVSEPHLYERWTTASTRSMGLFKEESSNTDPRDTFWKEYQRITVKHGRFASVLFSKVREQLLLHNPTTASQILSDYQQEASQDIILGDVVDREDFGPHGEGRIKIVNYDGTDVALSKSSDPDSVIDQNWDDLESGNHINTDAAEASFTDNDHKDLENESKGGV